MIELSAIEEILALYKKHGWKLRRVLLSQPFGKKLPAASREIFGDIEIRPSPLDAAWFSRSSRPGFETWELRHFSETPFALVEVINDDAGKTEIEERLRDTELKMAEITKSRPRSA